MKAEQLKPGSQEGQTESRRKSLQHAATHAGRTRNILFWGYQLLLMLAFFPTLREWYLLSGQAVHYSHIILIPMISSYLFYSSRRRIFDQPQYSAAGLVFIFAGLAAFGWGSAWSAEIGPNDALSITVLAILLMWAGGFCLAYGAKALKKAAFPVLFLLFAVPIPSFALERIISFLQQGSTAVAHALFQLTGTPFLREGFIFRLPGLVIEVAPECSGIRSSLALVITSVLAAHFFLSAFPVRMLLVLVAVPITIFKNGVRIITLSLLTIHVDEGFMEGGLHRRGGYPFFLFALAFLGIALWLLRRWENRSREPVGEIRAKPHSSEAA